MKRRLLIVENDLTAQKWITEQLQLRFTRSVAVACVATIDKAHQAIVDYGCDIIIANLKLPDGDNPASVIHALQALAPGIPIIALTANATTEEDTVLDVLTLGVHHILYVDDLHRDPSRLATVVVDTVRLLASRDAGRDTFSEQMRALSQKVWDVDSRMDKNDIILTQLVSGIQKLTEAVDRRGGLEDRVKELEKAHALALKVMIAAAGSLGVIISAILAFFKKQV